MKYEQTVMWLVGSGKYHKKTIKPQDFHLLQTKSRFVAGLKKETFYKKANAKLRYSNTYSNSNIKLLLDSRVHLTTYWQDVGTTVALHRVFFPLYFQG